MPSKVPITLFEGNDEDLMVTITHDNPGDSLLDVTRLEVVIKPDVCDDDTSAYALTLSSDDPNEISILTHTIDLIVALVAIPGAALSGAYDRTWRIDGISASGERRTAIYGPAHLINL